MVKITNIIIFVFCAFISNSQTIRQVDYEFKVNTIAELIAINSTVSSAIVLDNIRGGRFRKENSAGFQINNCTIFESNEVGKVWVRDYDGYVHSKWCGFGNGDISTDFQSFINTFNKIYFDKGDYKFKRATCYLKNGIEWIGENGTNFIQINPTYNYNIYFNNQKSGQAFIHIIDSSLEKTTPNLVANDGLHISNINFKGVDTATTTYSAYRVGMIVSNFNNVIIERCNFSNFGSENIVINPIINVGGENIKVINNVFDGGGEIGLNKVRYAEMCGNIVKNQKIMNGMGVSGDNCSIHNNFFYNLENYAATIGGSGQDGVNAHGNLKFFNNTILKAGGGILATTDGATNPIYGIEIMNNSFDSIKYTAITLDLIGDNLTAIVSNNTILSFSIPDYNRCVYVVKNNSSKYKIMNNVFSTNSADYGIYSDNNNVYSLNNIFENCAIKYTSNVKLDNYIQVTGATSSNANANAISAGVGVGEAYKWDDGSAILMMIRK